MTRTLGYRIFCFALCMCFALALFGSPNDPEAQEAPQSAKGSSESTDLRLAKSRLKLAKLELKRALEINTRSLTYDEITLELLKRNVAVAERGLEAVSEASEEDLHAAHLRELESNVRVAEIRLKSIVQLNERLPGSVDETQIESARLRAEIAKLAFARAQEPSHVTTRIDHMQWQLQQLRSEVLDLTLSVEELRNRR